MLPIVIGSAVVNLAKGKRKIPSLNLTGGRHQFSANLLEGQILDVKYEKIARIGGQ